MLRILKYLSKWDILRLLVILATVAAGAWFEMELPGYMVRMNEYLLERRVIESSMVIWRLGGIMMGLSLGALASAILAVFMATQMSAGFSARLREKLFSHISRFSAAEITKFSTPSLITRTTSDVVRVQMFIGIGARLIVFAPTMAIWAIIRIARVDWPFLVLVGSAVALILVLVVLLIVIAVPKFKKIQKLTDDINSLTRENLSGIRVIRAYNAEAFQSKKFETTNEDMRKTNKVVEIAWQVLMPTMMFVMSAVTIGIYAISASLIHSNPTTAGATFVEMMPITRYASLVIMSFIMLVIVFALLPRAVVSAKRINEVLDTPSSVQDGEGVVPQSDNLGTVEFRNVYFKYPDAEENILENISFKAKKGAVVAFIGSTGSGKSTLINLVPRFYDATAGEIFISGEDIRRYKVEELNTQLGYISQKGVIFSGSIKDNIAFGKESSLLSDDEVLEAARIAQALDFIGDKEGGLNHETAQGGTNLSGGQKQRLSIARAIAKRPEILIFDDSFSALDFKTDKKLRSALKKFTSGITQLVVAQRIGSIIDADKIVVLEKGKMVGEGTHSELLQNCEVYKEIALSQLSEAELKI